MTSLEMWLKRATTRLSADAAAQVRREIEEHFEAAREAALREGATAGVAEQTALAALGDAGTANCAYRKVMLTKGEARMLRESAWESGWFCSRGWVRWLLAATAVGASIVAVWAWNVGTGWVTPLLLAGVSAGAALGAAPMFLPIFTPVRGRIYRTVKMALFAGFLACALATPHQAWLYFVCIWPSVWMEIRRAALRRKMPQAEWPKHLYL